MSSQACSGRQVPIPVNPDNQGRSIGIVPMAILIIMFFGIFCLVGWMALKDMREGSFPPVKESNAK